MFFEEDINKTILERGYDYYLEGRVRRGKEVEDNFYEFEVEGIEIYDVKVELDEEERIVHSECNCPYDYGPVCKHEIACYYTIETMLEDEISEFENNILPFKNKVNIYDDCEMKDVLEGLSREELIDLVLELIEGNERLLEGLFLNNYEEMSEEILINLEEAIDSIMYEYPEEKGYMEDFEMKKISEEILEIIYTIPYDDIEFALKAYLLILDKLINMLDSVEDSQNHIGGVLDSLLKEIEGFLLHCLSLEKNIQEDIFNKLIEESEKKSGGEIDLKELIILSMASNFTGYEDFREILERKINKLIEESKEDEFNYFELELKEILLNIIYNFGTEDEMENFLLENIDESHFKKFLLDIYEEKENYKEIIDLTKKFEKEDREDRDLLIAWQNIRYKAYKNISAVNEQKELGKKLLLKNELGYYLELKELYKDDFPKVYKELILELKKDKYYQFNRVYRYLIEEEKDLKEMLELLEKSPRDIENYIEYFKEEDREEIIKIYKQAILLNGEYSDGRSDYKELARMIVRYGKKAGKESRIEVIDILLEKYPRKKALKDELNKVR